MWAENQPDRILSSVLDGAVVHSAPFPVQRDLLVETRDGRQIAVEIKWAGEGWPEDVRRVSHDIPDPWPEEVVVLARRLSPGAIEWLRERGANWADDAGQARIIGPGGLLVIREPAVPVDGGRSARSFSWSSSALSLAEAILALPHRPLRAAQLAEECQWSAPQIAAVLKTFDIEGWTIKRGPARGPGAHRELVDADAMLAAWSAALANGRRDVRVAHRATRDVMGLLRDDLGPALSREATWALSGWAALELASPFATTTPGLHVYVADEDFAGRLSSVIEDGGLREVDEGGRVNFWRADRRIFRFAGIRRGLPIVSAPRLYADLSSFSARGQDAADHVKSELIDPLHQAPRSDIAGTRDERR